MTLKHTLSLALIAGLPLVPGLSLAVTLPADTKPDVLQQQRMEEETLRRMQERLENQPETSPIRTEEAKPGPKPGTEEGPRFLLREVKFTETEIFSAEELKAFASNLEGKEVNFAEIQALVASINEAYKARRIVTAKAILETQDVSDGTLDIRLVEGRLGKINLDGNATTDAEYITDRVALKSGQLVDLRGLESDLKLFNRTNDVQLGAELKAGAAFGTSDLTIKATEPPKHDLRLLIDNNGSSSTGEWRAGLSYTNRSLTGARDDLNLTTIQAEGQQSYSVGYGIPVNTRGGRLSLGYFEDHTKVINGPVTALKITGVSKSIAATLRQPLPVSDAVQVDGVLTLKKRKSTTWSSGVLLNEPESQDGTLGVEAWQANAKGYWLASYHYTLGNTEQPTRESYGVGRGVVRASRKLDSGWTVTGNVLVQHTSEDLVNAADQQMLIGGEGSVRGYNVGTYSGEKGYLLSIEGHHPIGSTTLGSSAMPVNATGFVFVDHAGVNTFGNHDQLSSVGVGINAILAKKITLKTTLAYALNETTDSQKGLQFRFQLNASLF